MTIKKDHNDIKECDFDDVAQTLVDAGWTKIVVPWTTVFRFQNENRLWLYDCQGKYDYFYNVFVFENKKDAVAFTMRWC